MKHLFLLTLSVVLISGCTAARKPELVGLDYGELVANRKALRASSGAKALQPAYDKLLANADKYLAAAPDMVTDGVLPPSGDSHDFVAIGKYSWPNPETPDSLPWIRIDCKINPDAYGDKYDLERYNRTMANIKTLSLAWFYSQEEKYAVKAAELLRVWFIDEATRMNPNFEYASYLPGVYDGMAIGIIFGSTLVELIDHIKLISLSDSWTENDDNAMKKWFSGYTKWLLESDFGIKEGKAKNNHGTWYAAQVAASALYTGEIQYAKDMVELGKKQIEQQINQEGGLPAELKRDWAYHYSIYAMQGFTALALCADHVGVDLWNYKTTDGRGLQLAFGFLQPYLSDEKPWTVGEIQEGSKPNISALSIMRLAMKKYPSASFDKTVDYLYSIVPAGTISVLQ
ncbi:MAG: alginate lyase family protein [Tannerella sp.]|nr:alginate lyase family protein [Tannerella sp.]